MKKPDHVNTRYVLQQLRRDGRYQRYELLDGHDRRDYAHSWMRDVEDSVGTKYVIVVDVFKTLLGPELRPYVQFNDANDTTVEVQDPESLRYIEAFFDRMWRSIGEPRDDMLLN